MKLKKGEQSVLEYLVEGEKVVRPTEVGKVVGGKSPGSASSWGSSILGALVNFGLAEIIDKGIYRTTEAGKNAYDVLKKSK
jgi:hypothetical protein